MVCSTPERSAATAATNQTIAVDSTTIATERPLAAWRIPSVSPLGVDASLRLVSMLALDATASSLAAVTARSMPITDPTRKPYLRSRSHSTPDGDLVLLADQDRSRWGRGAYRRGPGDRPRVPAPQPARALPGPGSHQRRTQRRALSREHGLAPGCPALRTAACPLAYPGRRAQPGGRGGRGRRCRCGAGACRRPRPGPLPPLPCDPGGPVEPARPRCRRGAGLRRGDRRRHQFRRADLP